MHSNNGACSRFFHKILDSAKEKRFDCLFSKFGGEISADPQNDPLQKKGKKAEKSKKKLEKSKKWILSKKRLKYKNNKAFDQKSVSLRFLQF